MVAAGIIIIIIKSPDLTGQFAWSPLHFSRYLLYVYSLNLCLCALSFPNLLRLSSSLTFSSLYFFLASFLTCYPGHTVLHPRRHYLVFSCDFFMGLIVFSYRVSPLWGQGQCCLLALCQHITRMSWAQSSCSINTYGLVNGGSIV